MLAGGKKQYYLDPETELYLLGSGTNGRYYDPTTARFLNEDPIRQEAGDANLYRYVKNDPVNHLDPSGHEDHKDKDQRKPQADQANAQDRKALARQIAGVLEKKGGFLNRLAAKPIRWWAGPASEPPQAAKAPAPQQRPPGFADARPPAPPAQGPRPIDLKPVEAGPAKGDGNDKPLVSAGKRVPTTAPNGNGADFDVIVDRPDLPSVDGPTRRTERRRTAGPRPPLAGDKPSSIFDDDDNDGDSQGSGMVGTIAKGGSDQGGKDNAPSGEPRTKRKTERLPTGTKDPNGQTEGLAPAGEGDDDIVTAKLPVERERSSTSPSSATRPSKEKPATQPSDDRDIVFDSRPSTDHSIEPSPATKPSTIQPPTTSPTGENDPSQSTIKPPGRPETPSKKMKVRRDAQEEEPPRPPQPTVGGVPNNPNAKVDSPHGTIPETKWEGIWAVLKELPKLLIPNPAESAERTVEEWKKFRDPHTPGIEQFAAFFGIIGNGIFTVLDAIPIVGGVRKIAVGAGRRGLETGLRNAGERLGRKLAQNAEKEFGKFAERMAQKEGRAIGKAARDKAAKALDEGGEALERAERDAGKTASDQIEHQAQKSKSAGAEATGETVEVPKEKEPSSTPQPEGDAAAKSNPGENATAKNADEVADARKPQEPPGNEGQKVHEPTAAKAPKDAKATTDGSTKPKKSSKLKQNEIVISSSEQKLNLQKNWRNSKFEQEGLVYLLRDATTGEVLKVGQTTSEKFVGRFEKYVTAGNKTGRKLELEVFDVPLADRGAVEGQIRDQLKAAPGSLPWDNAGGRLGRPGSGTPSKPDPTQWHVEEE